MEAEKLQENKRPEQLVYRPHKRAQNPNRHPAINKRQKKAADTAESDANEGKGNRPKQGGCQPFGTEKIRCYHAQEEPAKIFPGIGCRDSDIGKHQAYQGDGDKDQAGFDGWRRQHRSGIWAG